MILMIELINNKLKTSFSNINDIENFFNEKMINNKGNEEFIYNNFEFKLKIDYYVFHFTISELILFFLHRKTYFLENLNDGDSRQVSNYYKTYISFDKILEKDFHSIDNHISLNLLKFNENIFYAVTKEDFKLLINSKVNYCFFKFDNSIELINNYTKKEIENNRLNRKLLNGFMTGNLNNNNLDEYSNLISKNLFIKSELTNFSYLSSIKFVETIYIKETVKNFEYIVDKKDLIEINLNDDFFVFHGWTTPDKFDKDIIVLAKKHNINITDLEKDPSYAMLKKFCEKVDEDKMIDTLKKNGRIRNSC